MFTTLKYWPKAIVATARDEAAKAKVEHDAKMRQRKALKLGREFAKSQTEKTLSQMGEQILRQQEAEAEAARQAAEAALQAEETKEEVKA